MKYVPGEPDDPSLTSGSHVEAEEERSNSTKLSSDIHKNTASHCSPPHTQFKNFFNNPSGKDIRIQIIKN